jgi:hypothetical protein
MARIIAALKNIDATMLKRVWRGLEYRIDVCLITRGVLMLQCFFLPSYCMKFFHCLKHKCSLNDKNFKCFS